MKLKGILTDLHLHLDGSLSIKTVKHLAKMQDISIPDDEHLEKLLSVSDECKDLNEYLEKFALPISLLQTKNALIYAMYSLCEELKEQGLMYAEIRFAPQLHTQKGLTQREVVRAVIAGKEKSSFDANIILCCMRGEDNIDENIETMAMAKIFNKKGVCAIDLAGAEAVYKTNTFGYFFNNAIRSQIPMTVHCGEADGSDSIWYAMSHLLCSRQETKRFGHGVRILEDDELTKRAVKHGLFFELCPTSNLNTKMFSGYENYPVKTMLNKGLKVTINTDNCAVSNTTIENEFEHIICGNNLDSKDVEKLLRNSVDASFASKTLKKQMHKKIDNHIF